MKDLIERLDAEARIYDNIAKDLNRGMLPDQYKRGEAHGRALGIRFAVNLIRQFEHEAISKFSEEMKHEHS